MKRASLAQLAAARGGTVASPRPGDLVLGAGPRRAEPCRDVTSGCLHPFRPVEHCCDGCPRTRGA